MIAEAMSGHTRLTGERHDEKGPPIEMAQAYGDLGPGTMAAMAILAALRHRDRTGRGQMIDMAQLDCMVAYNTALTGYTLSGLRPVEMRSKYPMGRGVGGLLECSDGGWIRLAAYSPKAIDSLRRLFGVEEVTSELVAERTRGITRDEAVEFYLSENLPVAPVYHVDEVLADPHLAARGMFLDLVHPLAGVVRVPNFPVRFSETPGVVASAAPLLGQHSREVLTGVLGLSDGRVDELVRAGVTSEA
jgi:crotonobetainyl-CoA:carnitine CoA-transferase CaiB-like acyl-CoA transferase